MLRRVVEGYLDAGCPWARKVARRRASSGARRRSATSSRTSRSSGCSRTRTRPPAACRPRPATATSSTACCPADEPHTPSLSLSLVRRELDEAMRVTTETLSQVTNLLAIVTAPPIETSTIRHIEVLVLQPQVVMVVVITSTGGVTKRSSRSTARRHRPRRLGGELPERAAGRPRARRADAAPRLHDPSLSATEAAFLDALSPVVHRARRTRGAGGAVLRRHRAAAARASDAATSPSSTR